MYRGRNEFDFRTTTEKPMILCGGTNGAGKTTLFESVMLCLYGKESFEKKISQNQYLETVSRHFHRFLGTNKSVDESSVILEFQFAHEGKISEYQIMRMWQNNDGKISENLRITKKSGNTEFTKLDEIEESQWQTFIDQLIPRGVAKLFFFDGEKIQSIADEGNDDVQIKASFDVLLGLDLVEQLNEDIGLSLLRNDPKGENKKILKDIEILKNIKKESEDKLLKFHDKRIRKDGELEMINKNILHTEDKFSKLGGNYSTNREEYKIKKAEYQNNLLHIKNKIRELCSDILPLCLIPNKLDEIKKEIEKDQKKIELSFEKNILKKSFDEISDKINSKIPGVDEKSQIVISKLLTTLFQKKLGMISKSHDTAFDLSQKDMISIIETIDKVNVNVKEELFSLAQSYNLDTDSLKKIELGLKSAPDDDEIGPIMSELQSQNRELGIFESEMKQNLKSESEEKIYLKSINSEIRELLTKKHQEEKDITNVNLAYKVQDVLVDYSKLLRKKKLKLLENYILDGLKILLHKKDFIEKVSINEENFEVKLFKGNNDEITKNMLSKGELQMYATAVLWGLAKTSGRPLPFMIDTPLARLDDEHRNSLVENFYPFASHQVIVLSTNSEINRDYYPKLEPFIKNSFVIKFDSDKGASIKHDGYFFNKKGEKIIEV